MKQKRIQTDTKQVIKAVIKEGDLKLSLKQGASINVTFFMRSYLSAHHLWAATHLAQLAAKIEQNHKGKDVFNIEHRAYVVNSIFSSVAFLENMINEIYQDTAENHESYIKNISPNTRALMASFWEVTERDRTYTLKILDKYQVALKLAEIEEFPKGENPYQSAKFAIDRRNELVHYKPSTQEAAESITHKLSADLRGKFPPNALMKNSANPFFPDKCLGHGCAAWVVKSCREMADAFCAKLNIKPNYQLADFSKLT